MPHRRLAPWLWSCLCVPALCALGAETPPAPTHIEHIRGSNFSHVHTLPLKDSDGNVIKPENELGPGFSTKGTCGKCHVYPKISAGWHFNAINPKVPPGRPGQPWFIANEKAATVIPLTYRSWPNTWSPDDLGMKPWKFLQTFGHHLPGGGPGEKTEAEDPQARWFSSGPLEVNCFTCHSGAPSYDHIQYFLQIAANNYLWAPAATLTELATVQGQVAKMSEGYDPTMGPSNEQEAKDAPRAVYNLSRFTSKKETFFDIPRRPLNQRCYFCHSGRDVGSDAPEIWKTDEDVHLRAGMLCVECHRNDEGHLIRRGYEQEPGNEDPRLWTLTCRGCHVGDYGAPSGRLGAPVPKHKGIPPLHLSKLTCTACHSGPYPGPKTAHLQTSQSHGPEFQRPGWRDTLAPIIVEPVFARRDWDGMIGPQRMVWPAFWGRLKDGKAKPLDPDAVLKAAPDVFKSAAEKTQGKLSEENVIAVLKLLGAQTPPEGEPVYVSQGRLFRLTQAAGLEASENPAAEPVAWPLAHNVRPANQALGAGGCVECHGKDAPFFFGEVEVPALASLSGPATRPMYSFLGEERLELEAWALSYQFRPLFKIIGFSAALILAGVLGLYGLLALRAVSACFSRKAASETEGKKE